MSVPSGLVIRTAAALRNASTTIRSTVRQISSGTPLARPTKSSYVAYTQLLRIRLPAARFQCERPASPA